MKQRIAVTDPRLSKYSGEHLLHELDMLWLTAAEIAKVKQRSFASSVLLESFVVHLRTLIEFFYFEPKEGYVRAKDFFSTSDQWNPSRTQPLSMALDRANGEASHLTWDRQDGTPAEKEWNVQALLTEIETVAKDFAARALASRLHPAVREFLGLPAAEKIVWLIRNVAYSNVASQTMDYSNAASTATMVRIPSFDFAESRERDVVYIPNSRPLP
jgi:hypothetical protein